MSKTFEYSQLSKVAKQKAFKDFKSRSLVLSCNRHTLNTSENPDGLIENYLYYSKSTIHERFAQDGTYLGLFNIHEESADF